VINCVSQAGKTEGYERNEDLVVGMTICEVIRSRISTDSLVTLLNFKQSRSVIIIPPIAELEDSTMLQPQLRVGRLDELDPTDILTTNFPTNFLNDVLFTQQANDAAQSERKKVTWTLLVDVSEAEHRAGYFSGNFGS
jgi:hypothetical protein